MWLLVINTYSGPTASWGNIICTKEREDKQLTFIIIRSTCSLVCYVSPLEAKTGAGVFSRNLGNFGSCLCKLKLTTDFKTFIRIISWLGAKHLLVSSYRFSHECCYFDHFKLLKLWMKKKEKTVSVPSFDCPVWKIQERKQMMSLSRFSTHFSLFHCSYPSSQVLILFLYLLWMNSQWRDRRGFHKQFIPNYRKIGCRS